MSGLELDHIGIAVSSLRESLGFYEALGWTSFPEENVPGEKVKVAFVKMKNACSIELLEPTDPESVIAKFIQKRGSGIHHICLRVEDIDQKVKDLKAKGIRLVNEVPRKGAHDCRVVFVHPSSAGGVLVELSEPPSTGKKD